jgi:dihydropyrimidinase
MFSLLKRTVFSNFSTYLLKNAKVVNSDMSFMSDVLLDGGKIAAVSENITHKTAKVIDCTGKMVIPGGIDTHAHMQMPFMGSFSNDDFDGGSKAALAGGTTCFLDFAIAKKGQTLMEAYNIWRGWADNKVNCDYGLHSVITNWDDVETPKEMKKMVELGVSTFKFFMAYKGELKIDDMSMMKAFDVARELGALVMVHSENGDIIYANQQRIVAKGVTGPEGHYYARPESVEAEAVHRIITIAENINCPLYIVHLMSKESSE